MKMRHTLCFIVALFAVAANVCNALPRQLQFKNFNTSDGLPDDSISEFAQDSEGFVWAGTKDGICRFDGRSFKIPSFISPDSPLNSNISGLYIDDDDVLWASMDSGLVSLDLKTYDSSVELPDVFISRICGDRLGNLWAMGANALMRRSVDGSWHRYWYRDLGSFRPSRMCRSQAGNICFTSRTDGCIYIYDASSDSFASHKVLSDESVGEGVRLSEIASVNEYVFVISTTDNSILYVNAGTGAVSVLMDKNVASENGIVLDVMVNTPEEYWISTDEGLVILDRNGSFSRVQNIQSDPLSLASSNLRCSFKDSQSRIWLGTYFKGVSCYQQTDVVYYRHLPEDSAHSLVGTTVRSICQDDRNNIWTATEDGYLQKIDSDGVVTAYSVQSGLPDHGNYQAICFRNGSIILGSYGSGVYVFNPALGRVVSHYFFGNGRCATLACTNDGAIYAGLSDGLYCMLPNDNEFNRVESVPSSFVHALCPDSSGCLWVGTYRQGLLRYNPFSDECQEVLGLSPDVDYSSMKVTSIIESKDGIIWFATEGDGVFRFDPRSGNEGVYDIVGKDKRGGLPSNIACSICQDKDGTVWAATLKGIVSFDKNFEVLKGANFDQIGNYFRYGAVMVSGSGRVYMGTAGGIVSFDPRSSSTGSHKLLIADVFTSQGAEKSPVRVQDGCFSVKSSETSSLTISLADISQSLESPGIYRYALTSKDVVNETYNIDNQITYINLSPGRYKFLASTAGDSSPDSSAALEIDVVPPFYATKAAKALYYLLLCVLLAFIAEMLMRRYRSEEKRRAEVLETEKQKEVYESKIEFFTNLSHEIRTPLTLIKIPLDKIIEKGGVRSDLKEEMSIIRSNTDHLLDLTNQMLDLRKLDTEKRQLNFIAMDVVPIVSEIRLNFKPMAQAAGIELKTDIPYSLTAMISKSSFTKILSNLVMNGIKYGKSYVVVSLSAEDGAMTLTVDSDGDLIAESEREKIFEPFYQSRGAVSNVSSTRGTGIGLALSRSLAVMHGGSLILDCSRNDCNSFALTLPLHQERSIETSQEAESEKVSEEMTSDVMEDTDVEGKYSILIVEDDIDLNNLLKKEFSDVYNVHQAYNGAKALEELKKYPVDLIISDVVMPEMDGCQLCNAVKSTLEFSHIPVLLLTAHTDYDTQLASLKSGADYYMTKPFSVQILRTSVNNLFKNREILSRQFSSKPFNLTVNASGGQDKEFMTKLYSTVMDNISRPQFSVFDLADQMCVSRSTLFRKVKVNTGQNVNEYIKICRLKKAAELLATGNYKNKEVTYMVGFSSSSYFSKEFQKQFNIYPSSLLEKRTEQE